jgi:hypothetical protein
VELIAAADGDVRGGQRAGHAAAASSACARGGCAVRAEAKDARRVARNDERFISRQTRMALRRCFATWVERNST